MARKTDEEIWIDLLRSEPKPVKLGNTNKRWKCGMCGTKAPQLFPRKVGQVDFMICANCKSIMDM